MKTILKKYNSMSLMAKASVWFIICNIFLKGISVITMPIFTRLLSAEDYGTYSLYLSWFYFMTLFTSLNLYCGAFNNALNRIRDSHERDVYISSMQGIITSVVFVLTLICIPFSEKISNALRLSKTALLLMGIHLLVEPSIQFMLARQRFEFRYRSAVALTVIKSVINPILGVILVVNAKSGKADARIFSVVLAEVMISGTVMLLQFARGKTFYHKKYWKYAIGFNVPLLPHYLSMVILAQADRVMIRKIAGASKVGIYSVAYNLGLVAQIFSNAITGALTPWTYEKLNKKDYRSIRAMTNTLLIFLAFVICSILMFVPELIRIFAPVEYYEAVYVVPPAACSVFFIFLYNIFAIPQMYYEKQKFMSIASAAAAVLNIILNQIFITKYGYIAAGYTTVACYLAYSTGHYIFCRKVCLEESGEFNLYSGKAIFVISGFIVSISVGFNFLYKTFILRYLLCTVMILLLILFRKKITDILKELKERRN